MCIACAFADGARRVDCRHGFAGGGIRGFHGIACRCEEYIIWPPDGAVIHGGKLWVRMGLRNMGVCPKGVAFPNTGHHHLLIDTDLPALDQEIPSDRNHLHFGAGETDARIELPPGKHTLQLILGDHNHLPHAPPVYSKKITITVQKD